MVARHARHDRPKTGPRTPTSCSKQQRRLRRDIGRRPSSRRTATQAGGGRLHGLADGHLRDARAASRRGAHHPQRRRCDHRRRHPLAVRVAALPRHSRDHPAPPHRLRPPEGRRGGVQGASSRPSSASSRCGRSSRSTIRSWTRSSRCGASRCHRSCSTRTTCAASSSTSTPASCTRWTLMPSNRRRPNAT